MNVIVVDDESAMHLIMSRLLGKLPNVEVVGCFSDTAAAEQFIHAHDVHVAFVDISMPLENGMQFAERMTRQQPGLHIIFITTHKDYALEAFELHALDYIVKPVSLERIEAAVQRAMAVHQYQYQLLSTTPPAERPHAVHIYALGGLEVRTSVGSVKWKTRKSAELFSYLLLLNGRMVSRAKIVTDIFGDVSYKNAETYLNTSIYQLRKALEPHGLKSIIASDVDGYGLILDDAWIDYVEFEERAKHHVQTGDHDIEPYLSTERMYVGDLFGERGFGWSLDSMERLSALYAAFVKKLAAALLERHASDVAIRLLNKLFHRNELDEETVGLLLRAYAAKKDRASFARLYKRYRKILRMELAIEPTRTLEDTYQQLRMTLLVD